MHKGSPPVRAILFEGSPEYEQFRHLPLWIQRTLQSNFRNLFRIYPADNPRHYARVIQDTLITGVRKRKTSAK